MSLVNGDGATREVEMATVLHKRGSTAP
jgi:hypothetical protein